MTIATQLKQLSALRDIAGKQRVPTLPASGGNPLAGCLRAHTES